MEKPMENPNINATPLKRLISLDALRGLTIAFMIMVNNNGGPGAWPQMHHAVWNGLTATDLVFPTFLFVVGVSIVFAYEARLAKGATRGELTRHTVQRAAVLFLFGIVVNGFPSFGLTHLRIYGVLQRIAICYLVVGLFYLWDRRVWTKVAALGVALVGYWILMRWVPVPGAGLPGRDIPLLDGSQNLTAWLDRQLLPGHLYEDWTTHSMRDPEGLLSDLPAMGTALLGLLSAMWLRSARTLKTKAAGLAAGSAACLALGYTWAIWFPLNKKLWTSSFVLAAAGWSLLVFALSFYVVEVKGWGKEGWTRKAVWPWLVFGSNAISAYMFSELVPGVAGLFEWTENGQKTNALRWMGYHVFARIPNAGWAAFAYSFSFMAFCFVPVWIMYRKKIFLKV
jgi:predicted acyltransferase